MKSKAFSLKSCYLIETNNTWKIYHPPIRYSFFEVLNKNMNKIDLMSNKICISGDFKINWSLYDTHIFSKKKEVK